MKRKGKASSKHTTKGGTKKSTAKKLISGLLVVSIAAVTGILSVLPASADEIEKEAEKNIVPQSTIEYVVDMPEDIYQQKTEVKTEKRRSKGWSGISILFWIIGNLVALFFKPVIGKILTSLLIAAIFFGILCACLKIMNPDKSLKEMLSKKNIITYLICTGIFVAAYNVPAIMDADAKNHGLITMFAGAVLVLFMVLVCSYDKKEINNSITD